MTDSNTSKTSKKNTKNKDQKSQNKSNGFDPRKKMKKMKQFEFKLDLNTLLSKGLIYLIILLLFVPFLISAFGGFGRDEILLSDLVTDIREERVEVVEVAGDELRATYEDDSVKVTQKETGQVFTDILSDANIDLAATGVDIQSMTLGAMLWELTLNVLPILLMVVAFMFLFRQMRGGAGGGGGGLMGGIGESKAKIFLKGKQDVSFDDVGGMTEAKRELEEIVDFLKNPKKYHKIGARTPKGVLMVGPAGTGKTLLARAVAGEADVQFLSIAGSEFMEMLVGVGASRVRDLFETAKKMSPAIIFIDEIDAVGRTRGRGSMGGHDEREQTLNQILVEMDGFEPNDDVVVMAATNRGDMLDPALVRPGRFDRRVKVSLPDLKERRFILKIHAEGKPFVDGLEWERVARRTVGFSGADLENMLNEAAIAVAREERTQITMEDIEEASLKVKLGPSKRRLQSEYERRMTAYHEAGHAIIAHLSPWADPVHRISIISRGQALGFTLTPPERDKVQTTKSELIDNIRVYLGGRAAELLEFEELTAGASSDIERATKTARAMVTEFGMTELGPINYLPHTDDNDYNRVIMEPQKVSDHVQQEVDAAMRKIIQDQVAVVKDMLDEHRDKLDAVSEALLERETLDTKEFEEIMGVEKVRHPAKEAEFDLDEDDAEAEDNSDAVADSDSKSKSKK